MIMPKGTSKRETKFAPVHLSSRTSLFPKLLLIIVSILVALCVQRCVEDNEYYKDVCLSGFSEKRNREGIAEYYNEYRSIGVSNITSRDIVIYNIKKEKDDRYSYEYIVSEKKGFGLGIGNSCGVEDVNPDELERRSGIPLSETKLEALVRQALQPMPNQCVLVAEAKGRLVGGAWFSAGEYMLADCALMTTVHLLAVDAELCGRYLSAKVFLRLLRGVRLWSESVNAGHVFVHVTTGTAIKATDHLLRARGAKFIGGGYVYT